jgi:hypothetical protein
MAVIEALCFTGDLILNGTAQAAARQGDVIHGSSNQPSNDAVTEDTRDPAGNDFTIAHHFLI